MICFVCTSNTYIIHVPKIEENTRNFDSIIMVHIEREIIYYNSRMTMSACLTCASISSTTKLDKNIFRCCFKAFNSGPLEIKAKLMIIPGQHDLQSNF